jgi:hypothetical protein
MEIMASNLSDNVHLSEGPLAMDRNTVLDANETSIPFSLSAPNVESEIPSHHVESTTTPSRDGISSSDEVDSALRYAMRDQRERVALLRLEQTMVDFMNNQDVGYMDVGGPNNSMVIHPNNNTTAPGGKTSTVGRQTSFQRCCLHRLADRFHIVRETTPDGMIRLVKVKDSQIPSKLLIDLEPPEYDVTEHESSAADVRALTHKLSDTSVKTQKMKIMKRSSSSLGSSNSLKNSAATDTATRNRKKLSDKEKAYAEARARIFNDENNAELKTTSEERTRSPQATPPERVSPSLLDQPATTDSSVSSKVTWRNRREEENDPDFYRLAGRSSHYDAYATAPGPVYGYMQQQQQQQQQQYFSAGSQQFAAYIAPPPAAGPYSSGVSAEAYYAPPLSSPVYYYQGGGGRGRGGRGGVPQRTAAAAARGEGSRRANVNSMDEFPSL